MKKMIFAVACLMAGFSFAGPQQLIPVVLVNVTTNLAAPTVATNPAVGGYFDGVYFDITGTATCTVSIAASNPARTLFAGSISADGYKPVRVAAVTTANGATTYAFEKIPLASDTITFSVYADVTNVNLKAYVYVTDDK